MHKDPDSDFGVSFPDFPGCVTAGKTLEEAQRMAREALALHIAGMVEDDEAIPQPSGPDTLADDPARENAVAVWVSVYMWTARTGHGPSWITRYVVDPKSAKSTILRPRMPKTIRSVLSSTASWTIS